jgi:NF-kappa-B inhibitor-interacting Ras-like protein
MGKTCKVVVCGQAAVGKTAILEQLVNGDHVVGSPMFSTIEDIYVAMVDTDRGQKEKVHFYDTAGLDSSRPELPKQYLSFADGFVIVYDVTNESSFQCMDKLKKLIEKNKEKKEAVIVSLGNKCDLKETKQVDFNTANKWAQTEKVRLWEVSVSNRQSLLEPFVWITSKMTQPQAKSFQPFSSSRSKKASYTDQ